MEPQPHAPPFAAADAATIRAIEAATLTAWPPLAQSAVDGWRLRSAFGVTGRANSVWALEDDGALPLDAKIAAAEAFYRAHSLPPRFQINAAVQPPHLDAELAARGYRRHSPTLVQTAPLTTILAQTPTLRTTPHFVVEVAEEFDDGWYAAYTASEAPDPRAAAVRAQILRAIEQPRAFARLDLAGVPVAVGLGVVGGTWLGIFCMTTHPAQRRRGAATALLRTLAIWASLYDATNAYLQVTEPNVTAQATYAKVGFTTAYAYHYRILD